MSRWISCPWTPHLERNRIVTLDLANPYRREFDLLRTQVLQKMQEHGWRTIAVTSPSMQSGKTVVAVNLALSIAHHPSKAALLVDFDLRRPQVAAYLGLPRGDSLNDVLEGAAKLRDVIVHAGIPKFLVLPTHSKVAGAAEILASEKIAKIISGLRDQYPERIMVLDLPPITAVDDVIAVLPRVDCVLLVVGSGNSTKREIEESQRRALQPARGGGQQGDRRHASRRVLLTRGALAVASAPASTLSLQDAVLLRSCRTSSIKGRSILAASAEKP